MAKKKADGKDSIAEHDPPKSCFECFPDIWMPIPPGEEAGGPTERKNHESKILYLATRHLLRRHFQCDTNGASPTDPSKFPTGVGFSDKVLVTSVIGHLRAHSYDDPSLGKFAPSQTPNPERTSLMVFDPELNVGRLEFTEVGAAINADVLGRRNSTDIVISPDDPDVADDSGGETFLIAQGFVEAVTDAVKHHNTNRPLYQAVFKTLQKQGTKFEDDGVTVASKTLHTRQLSEVTGRLVEAGVSADDPQLSLLAINALTQSLGGFIAGSASDFDIDLPDLGRGVAVDIQPNNVRAVAAIYFSAMLEEMRLYAVTEKIAEHFMIGMIPISRGRASDRIHKWIKDAPDRFTEIERRGVYGRILGLAQGAASDVLPNREFGDAWLRFLSTVSLLDRERRSSNVLLVSREQALKSARDLAVNISLHGFGIAHPAAVEMQDLIHQMMDMLSEGKLHTAYGVQDIWQLVDRVNSMYLGGYVNGVRYRTMAQAGANIILWLADNAPRLQSVAPTGGLDFNDRRLVDNVERWLAVTGTPDASVQQYTDPVDLQAQPTVPGFAPSNGAGPTLSTPIVREALDQVGIDTLPAIPQV